MSNKFFKSIFAFAMVLGTAMGFVGCTPQEEPAKADPKVELSESTLLFTAAEESKPVNVTSNSNWTVVVDAAADWVTVTPTSGKNNGTITVHVAENTSGVARSTEVKVSALNAQYDNAVWDTKKLTISQSADQNEAVEEEVLYSDNFDAQIAEKQNYNGSDYARFPYIEEIEFANAEGPASAGVTYGGNKMSVRSNRQSNYNNYPASGNNNIFFGDGGVFLVNNIAPLKAGHMSYKISFVAEKYHQDHPDSQFSADEFKLYISKNGVAWSEIEYTRAGGNEPGVYSLNTADFTLNELPEALYIKFTTSFASAYRIDDLKLMVGNGGQQVTLPEEAVLPQMTEVTVEQFLAAAEDATIYKLTGEITNVVNTQYGNFDITDATGTVYVYGLLTPAGEQQKQFAAAGLKQGDTITVYGTRTSYNGEPQMKNATYISHVVGEGTQEPVAPAEGPYASDVAFVCSADDSTNAVYSLGTTTINGSAATGFKLSKSKQAGKFTSAAVGVSGNKYLNFYAVAWTGTSDMVLYYRVDGGAIKSQALVSNAGATGNTPYNNITVAATDHYSVLLEGLTETSTIEFSTDPNFEFTTYSGTAPDIAPRAIVFGVKLTDEPLAAETTPSEPVNPDAGEPTEVASIAEVLALSQGAALSGTIEAVVISNYELNNLTSKKGMYVQDETGALQLRLSADHTYAFGTKVQIDFTGTTLGQYGGAVQVEVNAANITEVSTGNTVEPKTVAMADFLANKYEGQYVALEGVQVVAADLSKTWVTGGAHTNINMEDAQGNKFIVFSSKYATYAAETVAQGAGTIKGIASINNGNIQIIFAQASDYAGLTGERFEGEVAPEPTPGEDPVTGNTATIDFNNAGNRVSFTSEQQVWEQNGITVTNDKGSSTSNVGDYTAPARFYKSSNLTIAAEKAFTQVVFYCDDYKATYPTDLQSSITTGSVTVNGTVVTVDLEATTSFAITTLAGQVRVDSITVVFAE